MMATPIAASHIRIRVQSPMFTMSETAPIVQKLLRLIATPTTKAMPKVAQVTRCCSEATSASVNTAQASGQRLGGGGGVTVPIVARRSRAVCAAPLPSYLSVTMRKVSAAAFRSPLSAWALPTVSSASAARG